MLAAALKYSAGEYSIDQLRAMVARGQHALLVATDDQNEIHGAATVAFENHPNQRIAFVTTLGGRLIVCKELRNQLFEWCRDQGATRIRGACRKSAARLFERMGMKPIYIIMDKQL